jgi:hypothetical protein
VTSGRSAFHRCLRSTEYNESVAPSVSTSGETPSTSAIRARGRRRITDMNATARPQLSHPLHMVTSAPSDGWRHLPGLPCSVQSSSQGLTAPIHWRPK